MSLPGSTPPPIVWRHSALTLTVLFGFEVLVLALLWGIHRLTPLDPVAVELRRDLSKSSDDSPPDSSALARIAARAASLGRLDLAVSYLEQAITPAPSLPELRSLLGDKFLRLGLYSLAIEAYSAAEHLSAIVPTLDYNFGLALGLQGDHPRAAVSFLRDLRRQPHHPNRLYNAGVALLNTGDLELGTRLLKQALVLDPGFSPALQALLDRTQVGKGPGIREPFRFQQILVRERRVAEALLEQVQQGALFSTLAEQYSEDESRQHGGDSGPIPRENMPPELAGALTRLRTGEIGPIIESPRGYHLVLRLQ